jgi:hypothetical protein
MLVLRYRSIHTLLNASSELPSLSDLPSLADLPSVKLSELPSFSISNSSAGSSSLLEVNSDVDLPQSKHSPQVSTQEQQELEHIRNLSSVDYFSCCGLGHRLSKNADAYYVATRVLNFGLRVFWGFCDRIEVAHYLFGPQPVRTNVTSTGLSLRLHNEVHGFKKLVREGKSSECRCSQSKLESDVEYYANLRNRFRFQRQIQDFRKQSFDNHFVVGMHIRAGNNETGDFVKKNRGIHDFEGWMQHMVRHLKKLVENASKPCLLYLATDTAAMVQDFAKRLNGTMDVVELPQSRPQDGQGVLFGARGSVHHNGKACLEGWKSAVMDMILLSCADVVVAARPSSFVQTMPMILSLGLNKTYCEVSYNGTEMLCFDKFMTWCCESLGSFFFGDINQRYDYIRLPYDANTRNYSIQKRGRWCRPGPKVKAQCLPYDWPSQPGLERKMQN